MIGAAPVRDSAIARRDRLAAQRQSRAARSREFAALRHGRQGCCRSAGHAIAQILRRLRAGRHRLEREQRLDRGLRARVPIDLLGRRPVDPIEGAAGFLVVHAHPRGIGAHEPARRQSGEHRVATVAGRVRQREVALDDRADSVRDLRKPAHRAVGRDLRRHLTGEEEPRPERVRFPSRGRERNPAG